MARRSDVQKIIRVAEVAELLLSGAAPCDIKKYAISNDWPVTERTVDNYISEARIDIERSVEGARSYRIAVADRRLNKMYAISMENGDIRAALAAQQEYNKLYGLHTPHGSGNDGTDSNINITITRAGE